MNGCKSWKEGTGSADSFTRETTLANPRTFCAIAAKDRSAGVIENLLRLIKTRARAVVCNPEESPQSALHTLSTRDHPFFWGWCGFPERAARGWAQPMPHNLVSSKRKRRYHHSCNSDPTAGPSSSSLRSRRWQLPLRPLICASPTTTSTHLVKRRYGDNRSCSCSLRRQFCFWNRLSIRRTHVRHAFSEET